MNASLTIGLVIACAVIGCGSSPEADGGAAPQCLPELDRSCTPLYAPTFDALFANRLSVTCGSPQTGRSCHGSDGAMGGLVLATSDDAYAHLLGNADGRARVIPGDPECSLLMQRLESKDPSFAMPPGSPLSEAERCSILLWIDQGAKR